MRVHGVVKERAYMSSGRKGSKYTVILHIQIKYAWSKVIKLRTSKIYT